jgi:NAD(P)-dependent dehydrogenase (short-subunit alcohol dehydrogenase family)
MNQFTNKADVVTGGSVGIGLAAAREPMNLLIKALAQARPRTT